MTCSDKPPIVLHACCGPCLTHCALALRREGREPIVFYSNSNIAPRAEYELRLASARKLAAAENIEFIEDEYDHDAWLASVRGLENEPEGGGRCAACFRFNLSRATRFAAERGIAEYTTTLTVSPKKRSATIFAVAASIASAAKFVPYDFKKKNGFLESVRLAEQYGLYRQNYCGCGL